VLPLRFTSVPLSANRITGGRAGLVREATRWSVAVVVCAFAAHAVAYGSPWPSDEAHGYFVWYAPIVAAVSVVSLIIPPLALALALTTGKQSRLVRAVARFLPAHTGRSARREVVGLAASAFGFLLAQESLERWLTSGRLEIPSFPPLTWLTFGVAVLVVALVVVLVERAVSSLADAICSGGRARVLNGCKSAPRLRPVRLGRRECPLAVHGGLRAPPLIS
jgi:hypothetical protein